MTAKRMNDKKTRLHDNIGITENQSKDVIR